MVDCSRPTSQPFGNATRSTSLPLSHQCSIFSSAWWERRGRAVLTRTLETLPAWADRERVALVGLSNGAIGVTAIAADPALAHRFFAIVAIEGVGSASMHAPPIRRLDVLAAQNDPRFPYDWVVDSANSFRDQGADVRVWPVPGDHLAFFDQFHPICERMEDLLVGPSQGP